MSRLFLILLLPTSLFAQVQPPTPPASAAQLDKVEVSGQATDESRRRASTASKIVISREDLLRFGDGNLVDLMRRLPGVTPGGRPGRGGEIRMRGMGGGFTQILVDGERMPPGFAIDQIPPEQVERIEIQRAPTAETGARAVAGTINIILREPLARQLHEARLSVGGDHGAPQANISWTRNDSLGPGLNYSLTAVANHQERGDDINTRQIGPGGTNGQIISRTLGSSQERRDSVNLNGRLLWRLGEGEQLTLMPFLVLGRGRSSSDFNEQVVDRYDTVHSDGQGDSRTLRLGGNYQKRLAEFTRLELRGHGGRTQQSSDSSRQERRLGSLVRTQDDHSETRDDNLHLTTKLSHQTAAEHSWVSGLELEAGRRDNQRRTLENGAPKPGLADFGEDLQASTRRLALYTQDEWQASPQWNLHAGLRWEGIESRGDGGPLVGAVRNRSEVLSPLLHALWKPDPKSRDQLRMSLTRSYRGANLNDLIARPAINNQFPSGPNTELTPDRAGNPSLRPELATGLELGWEHYLSKGGLLSANLFTRQIQGLIRSVIALETVSWDSSPRFVARPRNLSDARTAGLELEAKARLDELWPALPNTPLQLRANLSLFTSQVEGIEGPHNRIDAQPRFSANLGADYRQGAWSLGANWSYVPTIWIQQTETLQVRSSPRSVIDAYLQWTVDRTLSWRLGLANLSRLDTFNETLIESAAGTQQSESRQRSFTTWTLRAEMRF
ncbi:iron complex outermembrane receptor protein [Inhella inkyongensis]|uniref:Iron complex outermembrane receptor protein n=1 Tax=Inhella inkyongensis TaxID=392593 RepID=A0A840RWQ7_9BURK|nr:TonB-dependent receptor [Inhella inkyongensis]MBB5203137.1 iron complex outermembrane receptor protein [Inhella inkyongensis]